MPFFLGLRYNWEKIFCHVLFLPCLESLPCPPNQIIQAQDNEKSLHELGQAVGYSRSRTCLSRELLASTGSEKQGLQTFSSGMKFCMNTHREISTFPKEKPPFRMVVMPFRRHWTTNLRGKILDSRLLLVLCIRPEISSFSSSLPRRQTLICPWFWLLMNCTWELSSASFIHSFAKANIFWAFTVCQRLW